MIYDYEIARKGEAFTTTVPAIAPQLTAGLAAVPLSRPIVAIASEHRCPSCRSIVYSRRHRLCGVCCQPLPEEHMFTITEARRIESLLASERRMHRKWLTETFQILG